VGGAKRTSCRRTAASKVSASRGGSTTSSRPARCISPDGAVCLGLMQPVERYTPLVVNEAGGFLGLAHSHYPIPWSALTYDTGLGGFRTGITEEQLRDAPEFSDDSWTDRSQRGLLRWCTGFSFFTWEPQVNRSSFSAPAVSAEVGSNGYLGFRSSAGACLHGSGFRGRLTKATDKASCDKAGGVWDDSAKKCSEKM
jgi:hypothetical protein